MGGGAEVAKSIECSRRASARCTVQRIHRSGRAQCTVGQRERAYRFLPPFFFPPLAFFAIASIPPFTRGIECVEPLPHCSAAASAAGLRLSAVHRFVAENFRAA